VGASFSTYSECVSSSERVQPNNVATPYEPPRLVELGSLHSLTLRKLREGGDGFSFTGPRIVNGSP
jgi:hypothetical protein